jgi:putative SOS response-associated peptidase YedK
LITTPANQLLAEVHNEKLRMPTVLQEDNPSAWLHGATEEALQALDLYPSESMTAWQVSRRLYGKKNAKRRQSYRARWI